MPTPDPSIENVPDEYVAVPAAPTAPTSACCQGEGSPAIVIERACVSSSDGSLIASLSATRTVKFEVPDLVGVPEITPVDERLSPAGSVPDARLHTRAPSPPVAASVCEYAVPTVPFGSVVVMMLGTLFTTPHTSVS